HQKTEIKEALVANSKHHRSPYISTTFMRFPYIEAAISGLTHSDTGLACANILGAAANCLP
uniref:hypothetical protein n=1 Tax=Vibrio cholerae TaxID=666 RepID=UPI001C8EE90C